MRFSYSMPRVVLLIFGVAYFALWAWQPMKSDDRLFFFLGYLFPALLYSLAAFFPLTNSHAPGDAVRKVQSTLRDPNLLFALAAVLYLPMLFAVAISEGLKKRELISASLGICFVVLSLSFAYEQTASLAEGNANGKAQWLEKVRQRIRRWFLRVAGWLHPGVLIGTGAILVLTSLFLRIGDSPTGLSFLRGEGSWVTSISEVTGDIGPIQATKAFLGRAVYMIALGLAATAIIITFGRKFRPSVSRPSRLWTGLTGLSSFLAIYSATDLNFAWLGLSSKNTHVQHWTLFCLWLALWLLPLAFWVWLSFRGYRESVTSHMPDFSWLILLFLPVVLYDVDMAPVLVGDFLNLTGIASYVAGLQFLCWGFLRSITLSLNKRPSVGNNLESTAA